MFDKLLFIQSCLISSFVRYEDTTNDPELDALLNLDDFFAAAKRHPGGVRPTANQDTFYLTNLSIQNWKRYPAPSVRNTSPIVTAKIVRPDVHPDTFYRASLENNRKRRAAPFVQNTSPIKAASDVKPTIHPDTFYRASLENNRKRRAAPYVQNTSPIKAASAARPTVNPDTFYRTNLENNRKRRAASIFQNTSLIKAARFVPPPPPSVKMPPAESQTLNGHAIHHHKKRNDLVDSFTFAYSEEDTQLCCSMNF